jgi:hypothetical protein
MDWLVAIAADPTHLPLWGVLLFAVMAYPVGILFGCSNCCEAGPCTECEEGELPDTVTVTFSNLAQTRPSERLLPLEFVSCFGSGAAAAVSAPGGDRVDDRGPVEAVELLDPGSGYAVLGRIAPTVTASAPTGTGAGLTVSLEQKADKCGRDYWAVSGLTLTAGGTGYPSSGSVTFSAASGDTVETPAVATFTAGASAPTLTASVSGGTGAVLAVNVTTANWMDDPIEYGESRWKISSISVTTAGTGYTNGTDVTISLGTGDVQVISAKAKIVTDPARIAPDIGPVEVYGSEDGSGAVLTASLESYTSGGQTLWRLAGVTIVNGGTGYTEGKFWRCEVTSASAGSPSVLAYGIHHVDGSGTITSIEFWDNIAAWKDGVGPIQSVTMVPTTGYYGTHTGGIFYKSGAITAVSLTSGGTYYREDAELPPYIADVEVDIVPNPPRGGMGLGTGATFSAVIDDDPESATFGKITGVTITNAGTDYLAWFKLYTDCCQDFYGDAEIVLKRQTSNPCMYRHRMCSPGGRQGYISAEYLGSDDPMLVRIVTTQSADTFVCGVNLYAETLISDCSAIDLTASDEAGAEATVVGGGVYDELYRNPGGDACEPCCYGSDEVPEEFEVELTDSRGVEGFNWSGTYVMQRQPPNPVYPGLWYAVNAVETSTGTGNLSGVSSVYFRTPCASTEPEAWGCPETDFAVPCCQCHKTCQSVVKVDFYDNWHPSGSSGSASVTVSTDNLTYGQCNSGNASSVCRSTPLCHEPGRTFTLKDIYNTSETKGSLTISE